MRGEAIPSLTLSVVRASSLSALGRRGARRTYPHTKERHSTAFGCRQEKAASLASVPALYHQKAPRLRFQTPGRMRVWARSRRGQKLQPDASLWCVWHVRQALWVQIGHQEFHCSTKGVERMLDAVWFKQPQHAIDICFASHVDGIWSQF